MKITNTISLCMLFLFWFLSQACAPKPPPCLTDSDCLRKQMVCRGNLCIKQSTCSKDEDCTYKGEVCKNDLCQMSDGLGPINPPPTTCPSACSSNKDCVACKNGRAQCIRSICAVKEPAKAFERCGDSVGKACGEKMICIGASNTYCIPECDPKNKRCEGGKAGCYDPQGTGAGICLPDGGAKEGGTCTINFIGDAKIDTSVVCKSGLHCVKSVCKVPSQVAHFAQCGSGKICKDDAHCVSLSATESYCLPNCDANKATCETGGRCAKLKSNQGACLPKATGKAGTKCGPGGLQIKGSQLCETGLACVQLSEKTAATCFKSVTQCSETSCPSGFVCLPGQAGGLCAPLCKENACPIGYSCVPLTVGKESVGVCALN